MAYSDSFKGKFLHTDELLEVWYVSPRNGKRTRVTLNNVTSFFKGLFSKVSDEDLDKIPVNDQPETKKNITLRKKLAGRLLQAKNGNDMWYVDTEKYKRWKISHFELIDMLKALSIKVTHSDLDKILINDASHAQREQKN